MQSQVTGKILKVVGKTRHGKNRVIQHGEFWRVLPKEVKPAPPDFFVESVETGDKRWLSPTHFKIIDSYQEVEAIR